MKESNSVILDEVACATHPVPICAAPYLHHLLNSMSHSLPCGPRAGVPAPRPLPVRLLRRIHRSIKR